MIDRHGTEPPALVKTTSSYNKLITHSSWREAFHLLQEANCQRVSDLVTYNTVLGKSPWNQTLQLLRQLHRIQMQLDCISFNASIKSTCEKWEASLHLASSIKARELQPNIISSNSLMVSCTRAQRWMNSVEIWNALLECRLEATSVSYTLVLQICEAAGKAAGKWQDARRFLEEMHSSNLEHHLATYTAAISATGKCGDWEGALSLLGDMTSLQLQASLITINAVFDACAIANQWLAALELKHLSTGMEWDAATYTSLISACAAEWQCAIWLFCESHSKTLATSLTLQNSCISAVRSQWEQSLLLLHHITEMALEPSLNTLNPAILACAMGEEWSQSLELLEQMGKGKPKKFPHIKPDSISFTSILMSCNRGEWQRALSLLSRIPKHLEADIVMYNSLMYACGKGLQWERTLQILAQLLAKSLGTTGAPNEKSFIIAIHSCNLSGEWQQALLVLEKVCCLGNMFLERAVAAGACLVSKNFHLLPCLVIPPLIPMVHSTRRKYGDKKQLMDDLKSFELDKVSCASDFDAAFIRRAIEEWYGSKEAFTEFVRGPLLQELQDLLPSPHLPWTYVAFMLSSMVSFRLEYGLALARAGATPQTLAIYFLSATAYVFGWLFPSFNALFYLCDKTCESSTSLWLHWVKTLGVTLAVMICNVVGEGLSVVVLRVQQLTSTGFF
eukprot:Skav210065  [mRNA]  locus=scaffold485:105735:115321:+ [translate_table: standard]